MPTPKPVGNMEELIQFRAFHGTKKIIARRIKKNTDRWNNESHYLRSAIIFFERYLDYEQQEKKRLRK